MESKESELARSWRRVASTHALQALITPEAPQPSRKAPITTKLIGLAMLLGAVALVSLHVAHTAAVVLPPSRLPPALRPLSEHSQLLFHLAFAFHATAAAAFLHWFNLKLFKHNSS